MDTAFSGLYRQGDDGNDDADGENGADEDTEVQRFAPAPVSHSCCLLAASRLQKEVSALGLGTDVHSGTNLPHVEYVSGCDGDQVTTDNGIDEATEGVEEQKSFFARGAFYGLIGGAVVALMLISVVGSVDSLFDDVFGSSTPAAADEAPVNADPVVAAGEDLATNLGCAACHSSNGVDGTGPTWKGLSETVDAEYIRVAIINPNDVIAEGYLPDVMPANYGDSLSESDLDALVAYISSL